MVKKTEKHYAHFEHETVQAMLHSLFRFQTAMQAQLVSNRFADEVILSPRMSDPKDRRAIILWVRDLDVTEEQRQEGYLGNYAKISLLQLPNGKWTLSMTRIDMPLKRHPVKANLSRRYPNTGHPVIRGVERAKKYPTMQAANDVLMAMHEEFPEVSVPGVNRLRIKMYQKAEKGMNPVQRVELTVAKLDEGEYVIRMRSLSAIRRSTTEKSEAGMKAVKALVRDDKPSEGPYTMMVNKRRKRKKRN